MLSPIGFSGTGKQHTIAVMLGATPGSNKQASLMSEYSTLVAESTLHHRAWLAQHLVRVEAEIANRVKADFISNMSHELRTPLNTVIGFAKLLGEHRRRRLKDAEIGEYADLIGKAAAQLLAVVNDILDISKMQSGTYALDARELKAADVLERVVSTLRAEAETAGLAIETRFDPDTPPISGDPDKLRRVFGNLIDNAIRFTPHGGMVTIETLGLSDGGAVVRVRDTGLGMTQQEIELAMRPFSQIDASRARAHDGAGLGLPIAAALVELHGGRLTIESTKARGTVVSVALPPHARAASRRAWGQTNAAGL